jgi:hypothetical protein
MGYILEKGMVDAQWIDGPVLKYLLKRFGKSEIVNQKS